MKKSLIFLPILVILISYKKEEKAEPQPNDPVPTASADVFTFDMDGLPQSCTDMIVAQINNQFGSSLSIVAIDTGATSNMHDNLSLVIAIDMPSEAIFLLPDTASMLHYIGLTPAVLAGQPQPMYISTLASTLSLSAGEVEITLIDYTNSRITGTFSSNVVYNSTVHQITNGVFDLPLIY